MKVTEAFDMYKNDFIRAKNQSFRTEETHNYVRKSLAIFTENANIRKLTLDTISGWREELLKSRCQDTVRSYVIRLRRVLDYCRQLGYKCLDPKLIQIPKREEKIPSFLTPEEVAKIIDSASNIRAKLIISLLYSSGLRVSEMCNLNRDQIRGDQFTVVGKGRKVRPCFIDQRTEEIMKKYLSTREDRCSALITTINGGRMRRSNVELIVRNAVRKSGINKKVTPHTFRHSYATDLLKNGMNIRSLADCLGHSSLDTTKRYTHIVNNELFAEYKKRHTF